MAANSKVFDSQTPHLDGEIIRLPLPRRSPGGRLRREDPRSRSTRGTWYQHTYSKRRSDYLRGIYIPLATKQKFSQSAHPCTTNVEGASNAVNGWVDLIFEDFCKGLVDPTFKAEASNLRKLSLPKGLANTRSSSIIDSWRQSIVKNHHRCVSIESKIKPICIGPK